MKYDGNNKAIIGQYNALQNIIKTSKHSKSFLFPKWMIITAAVLVVLYLLIPPLLGPVMVVLMGLGAVFIIRIILFLGKSPEQRIAQKQLVILKKAISLTLVQRGIGEDRADEMLKKFPEGFWGGQSYFNQIHYDEQLQQNFIELCHKAGMTKGGILMEVDSRLL